MKKLEKRALICLFFAIFLISGTVIYVYKQYDEGHKWALFPANPHIFKNGNLIAGTLLDKKGVILLSNSKSKGVVFAKDNDIAKANLHITGDGKRNISTGANTVWRDKLIGYNFYSGIHSIGGVGRNVHLTINAKANAIANQALGSRRGAVGVYNYKTGEILCMVSAPNYNPAYPPTFDENDRSGTYINRFTSGKFVPGSIIKILTTHAALEKLHNPHKFTYYCSGRWQIDNNPGHRIICTYAHGNVDIKKALSKSCNCAFGKLATELGADTMEKYTKRAGLTKSYNIDGIMTARGSFDFHGEKHDLAWSGVGQGKDLVNPMSMMIYMGSIASKGECKIPYMIKKITYKNGFPYPFKPNNEKIKLVDKKTAIKLTSYMRNNVVDTYGEYHFPNLKICAKSGTAQASKHKAPNAWFTGFLDDASHPYAFVVLVEEGGWGSDAAGKVTNTVLQYLVNEI